jgi:hypothetical protein
MLASHLFDTNSADTEMARTVEDYISNFGCKVSNGFYQWILE